jgi:hypothetical protein
MCVRNKKVASLETTFFSAGATGFEPAVSALTGPHVEPLHHAPKRRPQYYHADSNSSRKSLEGAGQLHLILCITNRSIIYYLPVSGLAVLNLGTVCL